MLEIELNGAPHRFAGRCVHDLAESLGIADQLVAMAVNRRVVPRPQWRDHMLNAHDKVDVVRAIGGG